MDDEVSEELRAIMEVDQELASILEMGDVYNSTREVEWIAATERRKFLQEAMGRSVPVVGRLRRRLRRNKDAATLLELSTRLETIQRDTLYMSEEVSLSGTASRIWDDLGSKFDDKKAGSVLQQAMMDCGAAMQDLGKAAQASLTELQKWIREMDDSDFKYQLTISILQLVHVLINSLSDVSGEAGEAGGGARRDGEVNERNRRERGRGRTDIPRWIARALGRFPPAGVPRPSA